MKKLLVLGVLTLGTLAIFSRDREVDICCDLQDDYQMAWLSGDALEIANVFFAMVDAGCDPYN